MGLFRATAAAAAVVLEPEDERKSIKSLCAYNLLNESFSHSHKVILKPITLESFPGHVPLGKAIFSVRTNPEIADKCDK